MKKFLTTAMLLPLLPLLACAQAYGPFGPTAGDAFGYVGVRTATPGGVSFTSIKGNGGTLVTPADPAATTYDDRFYQPAVQPAFAFNMYGTNQTAAGVFVSTNGMITFGGITNTSTALDTQVNASYTNGSLASATAIPSGSNMQVDRAFIAPHWDDMQFTVGQPGGVYVINRTVGGRQEYVVEWSQVAFFNSTTDSVSFQAVLRDDGTIAFNYNDTNSSSSASTQGVSATIGIHNLGGTTANGGYLQYSFNTAAALLPGDVIEFAPTPEPAMMGFVGMIGFGVVRTLRRRRA